MIVALIALFVALGGAGYAALKVPKKSVGTKQLKNKAVTGKKIKNATIAASKLKPGVIPTTVDAATLNGLAANELIRTAFATSSSSTTKTGQGTVQTTQITAPRPGFLVVNATSDIRSVDDDFAQCALQVDEATMPGSSRDIQLEVGAGLGIQQTCSTSSTQPVEAGAHKVDLESFGADPDITYGRGALQVLFVPFGPTG